MNRDFHHYKRPFSSRHILWQSIGYFFKSNCIQTIKLDSGVNASSGDNRRASSVPRTLREKQELKKKACKESVVNDILQLKSHDGEELLVPPSQTTTLGEKIQNFFNSHHQQTVNALHGPSSSSSTQTQKVRQNMFAKSKASGSSAFSSLNGPLKGTCFLFFS